MSATTSDPTTDRGAAAAAPSRVATALAMAGRLRTDPLLRNSFYIMATTVASSVLGYAFWLLVARRFGADVTGRGSAATSALQAAAILASAGAAAAMIEWLPKSSDDTAVWRQRVTAGLTIAAVGSALGALVMVALLGHGFAVLPSIASLGGGSVFVAGTVFFGLGLVMDYTAVSQRRGLVMLARNLVVSGLRIPLLFAPNLLPGGSDRVLNAWTAAGALSLLVPVAMFGLDATRHSMRPTFVGLAAHTRRMATSLVGQHLVTIAAMMTMYVLPLLVVARVSASANAYFYATWMLGSVFFLVSPAVSTALFAEGAADPQAMHALVRKASLIIAGLLVVPIAVYLVGGRLLLALFGPDYPAAGASLLVLLTLSAIPDAVTNVGVAVLRSTGRLGSALWLNSGMLVGCLVASWILLPHLGIVAVGVAWIASQTIGAVWVVLRLRRPSLRRPSRRRPSLRRST